MNKSIKTKEKKWIVKSDATREELQACESIASALGINPIIARLLYSRGYKNVQSAKSFLYMESEVLSDPYLLKDIRPAAERIIKALGKGEKITVYGDYDVDGVTAVCTIYLYLKSKGANIDYYIPNRAGEGYGVSIGAIDTLYEGGTRLIVTVDTGITADKEVEYAKTKGIDFVITDHHEQRQTLPEACAVVNPHRPDCESSFKELAGVGVVFKLICVIEAMLSGERMSQVTYNILKSYSDLIAIGTIADVMPIKQENRLIVRHGLSLVENTRRKGLSALIEASMGGGDQNKAQRRKKPKITSGYIGYTLAPRINAAGRIRSASVAVELFLCDDYKNAEAIAEELCSANKERQNEENKIMTEAYRMIEENGYDKMPVIVLDADNWHHGVIGIVSSRITEKFSKPSILVSFEGNPTKERLPDDVGKGSGRSVKGMNLVDALCACKDLLLKFGGHELAAGLSVTRENLPLFREAINKYAESTLTEEDLIPSVSADMELSGDDIDMGLAEQIRMLEPFGVGNPTPAFIIKEAVVSDISGVSDGKHTRLALASGKRVLPAMYFSVSPDSLGIFVGDKVDVLFNIDINEYNGRRNTQLLIRDLKKVNPGDTKRDREIVRFKEIWSGGAFSSGEGVYPSRTDFITVYRYIISKIRDGEGRLTVDNILADFSDMHECADIGYIKLRVIIKVMQEMNIVGIEELSDAEYIFTEYRKKEKSDLGKSHLLRKLRGQQYD